MEEYWVVSQISPKWTNWKFFYKQTNGVIIPSKKETLKKIECVTFIFYPLVKLLNSNPLCCCIIDFIVHVSSYFLESTIHCSNFVSVPSVHTSLFMFRLISFSPHLIAMLHFYFLSPQSHSFHLPQSISFMFTQFGCIHITWSFNHIVSFTFQPIPSLEINDLRVSSDKFLILDRYSLLEAELRWFYYSLPLYIKQEIQQRGLVSEFMRGIEAVVVLQSSREI